MNLMGVSRELQNTMMIKFITHYLSTVRSYYILYTTPKTMLVGDSIYCTV